MAEAGWTEREPEDRLATLFDRRHQPLFRLALRMTADREEARDLVQEAFLRAARDRSRIPTAEGEAEAWLVRIVINLCRDRRRRTRVRKAAQAELIWRHEDDRGPAAAVVARVTVAAALARLEPRRRAVVVLHELEQREAEEVAEILGMSKVTVRWHLFRARAELKKQISEFRSSSEEAQR